MNQIFLSAGFVGVSGTAEGVVMSSNAVPKRSKRFRLGERRLPLSRSLYAVGKEVMSEQLAGHISSSELKKR